MNITKGENMKRRRGEVGKRVKEKWSKVWQEREECQEEEKKTERRGRKIFKEEEK